MGVDKNHDTCSEFLATYVLNITRTQTHPVWKYSKYTSNFIPPKNDDEILKQALHKI